jgi:hypothetical protein
MSRTQVRAETPPDPIDRRAGTVRVLANALLVLLAFEVASMAFAGASIVAGESPPVPPVQLLALVAGYMLVRWLFVLPVLLAVLAGVEFVARHVPHARVLTAVVAFAPMVLWELTNSPGDFPSSRGALLGVTAVLFALVARLPVHATDDGHAAKPPAEPAVAPR